MVLLKVGDKISCKLGTMKVKPLPDEPEYHYVVLNDCQLQRKNTEWKNAQPLEEGTSFWNVDGLQGAVQYSGSTLEEHKTEFLGRIEFTANRRQACTITTGNIFEGAVRVGVRALVCNPIQRVR